jgi:hypothetical protein
MDKTKGISYASSIVMVRENPIVAKGFPDADPPIITIKEGIESR